MASKALGVSAEQRKDAAAIFPAALVDDDVVHGACIVGQVLRIRTWPFGVDGAVDQLRGVQGCKQARKAEQRACTCRNLEPLVQMI